MDVQKEINLRNAISYCIENNDANTATNRIMEFIRDEKEAINFIQCCTTLKIKELMTFEDYRDNLFIKADGVYQPKKSKLFRWYSEKQLKKMYNNESL
jgi:hypothetical protein